MNDAAKDVIVMYYTPWSHYCKDLAPIWEKLGESLVGSDITVAKMDAIENELAHFEVHEFPTIMWYPMKFK